MARSMTGFGQSEASTATLSCTARIKSVNSRFLQITIRIDPPDEELEIAVRRTLQESVTRGSVDASIRAIRTDGGHRFTFNEGLLRSLKPVLEQSGVQMTLDGLIRAGILRLSDGESLNSEEDMEAIMACLRRSIVDWNQSRLTEGGLLVREMSAQLEELARIAAEVVELNRGRTERVVERIRENMTQLLKGQKVGEERLLEEAAFQAQRIDINEEMDRLTAHFEALRGVFTDASETANGKRMEFLVQEMQREFTTMGSKAQEKRIAARVVDAKVLLEKLKQQAANIE